MIKGKTKNIKAVGYSGNGATVMVGFTIIG